MAADKHLETKLGPQGAVKRNAETYSGKLADKPIFTDFAEASKEDQALVEKLNASIGRATTVRHRAVIPVNENAETAKVEHTVGRMGKHVVWVENVYRPNPSNAPVSPAFVSQPFGGPTTSKKPIIYIYGARRTIQLYLFQPVRTYVAVSSITL